MFVPDGRRAGRGAGSHGDHTRVGPAGGGAAERCVHADDLRRDGRPDAPQADARAVRHVPPGPAPRDVRRRGFRAQGLHRRELPGVDGRVDPRVLPRRGRRGAARGVPRPRPLPPAGHRGRTGRVPGVRQAAGGHVRLPAQPPVLPLREARPVRPAHPAVERGGPRAPAARDALDAGGRGEALRPRPRERPGTQPALPAVPRRVADLPDRPLPGQGDGAEHALLPVGQHDLRTPLPEPPRGPRADHGGRDGRHGGRARRLLRRGGGPARHAPEPPPPAAVPRGDGAALAADGRRHP